MRFLVFLLSVFLVFLKTHFAFSQSVPIAITQVSDLDFGSAFLGDPQKRVQPGNSENAENASFLITGEPGATFTVTRPNRIWITNASTGDRIRVRRFRSRPNNSGRIRNNGERMIYVGATRNAIPTNISSGLYSGVFTLTVVY